LTWKNLRHLQEAEPELADPACLQGVKLSPELLHLPMGLFFLPCHITHLRNQGEPGGTDACGSTWGCWSLAPAGGPQEVTSEVENRWRLVCQDKPGSLGWSHPPSLVGFPLMLLDCSCQDQFGNKGIRPAPPPPRCWEDELMLCEVQRGLKVKLWKVIRLSRRMGVL
jgi:hypothetical protein